MNPINEVCGEVLHFFSARNTNSQKVVRSTFFGQKNCNTTGKNTGTRTHDLGTTSPYACLYSTPVPYKTFRFGRKEMEKANLFHGNINIRTFNILENVSGNILYSIICVLSLASSAFVQEIDGPPHALSRGK